MFGLAMAAVFLLDAIVIRMALLPRRAPTARATTWTLPRWLERGIPQVAIEPETGDQPLRTLEPAHTAT